MSRRGPGTAAMKTALTALVLGAFCALGALIARPAPAAAEAPNAAGITTRLRIRDIFRPKPVADLSGSPGSEGQAFIQWTAPASDELPFPKPDPVASYLVRVATFSAADLGGDTTAWFNAATPLAASNPGNPGSPQSVLTSLEGGVTYYFGLRSVDAAGLTSIDDDKTRGIAAQVGVGVKGIKGVTNLTAVTGAQTGEIALVWSAPPRLGTVEPLLYELRASSVGQISNSGQFEAAQPLSAFSPSPAPAPGAPGSLQALTVTGLVPGATYYFAVRARDSGLPAFKGQWLRNPAVGLNVLNSAQARFTGERPDPVTNLTAMPGAQVGQIRVTWTAPKSPSGVPLDHYVIKATSRSIASLGGDATAWFDLPDSTVTVKYDVLPAGATEFADISFLQALGQVYFFGLKTVDMLGLSSFIDLGASSVVNQAFSRPRPVPPIINLTAVAVSTESGRIDLAWTSPDITGMVPPLRYDVRASTTANMADNAEFEAAAPLSAFSPSQPPAVSSATVTAMSVTSLVPHTTYYFALRVVDSNPLDVVRSDWVRSVPSGVNVNNFAAAPLVANAPFAVTDLTALPLGGVDTMTLSWTAPRNANFAPMAAYDVRFATFSPADLGGDATAWFSTAASSTVPSAAAPGALVSVTLTGLTGGELYWFGVRGADAFGEVSPVDFALDPANPPGQVRGRPVGIAPVTDLTALPDAVSGAIDLTWTTPGRSVTTLPERFLVRVSTVGQIADAAAFAAARPLSAFTGSPLPAVGALGTRNAVTLTGLTPFTTYYFAVAVADASLPTNIVGRWLRDAQRNPLNFAVPSFEFREPDPVSDLTALAGGLAGEVRLEWTAPRNQNFVPISSYTVRAATFSPAALAGDATAWFSAAPLSYVYYPANPPGSREVLVVSGLEPGAEYFFGLRAFDAIGEAGHLDLGLDPSHAAPMAVGRPRGVGAVTGFVAVPGAGAGAVDLSWTTPSRVLPALPERYVLKVSTSGQIADGAAFAAAAPLSAFSSSPLPTVGAAASRQTLTLTGLTPFVTYYFAIRVEDSSAPVANAGLWLRDPLLARNTANFSVPSFFVNPPEPVTDLTALPGALEGDVDLVWTAPRNLNLMPLSRYEVRYATFPVAALANNATAWFSLAPSSAAVAPAGTPGTRETLTVGNLHPGATVYFAVRSVDVLDEVSFVDTGADPSDGRPQAATRPKNLAPGVPGGRIAVGGLKRAEISWSGLASGLGGAGLGLDFDHYRLERSTDLVAFATLSTQTTLTYLDRPLRAEVTAYYRLAAVDAGGLDSGYSPVFQTLPYTLAPQEPFGITFDRNGSTITLNWAKTARFETTEEFFDPRSPATDELSGYQIFRSTGDCSPYAPYANYGVGVTSHTEADTGQANFYKIMAVNDFRKSTAAVVVSPFGDQIYALPDCASKVVIGETLAEGLSASGNVTGTDIYIHRAYKTEQNGGEIMQTVEFTPLAQGAVQVKDFAFTKPVRIVLRYAVDGSGKPVPATAQSVAQDVQAAQTGSGVQALTPTAAADAKDLGLYWNDGKEFKKVYGRVDAVNQTVAVETPNLGAFQVRRVFRDAAATFDISNITTRVLTPNGDGKNDVMLMLFDNPNRAPVTGRVFDMRGAFVAAMTPGLAPDTLQWDGKMNGKAVTSGVYVYQVEGDGKLFNGTVVVAR